MAIKDVSQKKRASPYVYCRMTFNKITKLTQWGKESCHVQKIILRRLIDPNVKAQIKTLVEEYRKRSFNLEVGKDVLDNAEKALAVK